MKQYFKLTPESQTVELWDKSMYGKAIRWTVLPVSKIDALAGTHDYKGVYQGLPVFQIKDPPKDGKK